MSNSKTQVILLEEIPGKGKLGDEVFVASGYARNYLIPQNKALPATAEWREEYKQQREKLKEREANSRSVAQDICDQLHGQTVEIAASATPSGALYGSVGPKQVMDQLKEEHSQVEARHINIEQGLIRETGEFVATVSMISGIEAQLTVVVVPA